MANQSARADLAGEVGVRKVCLIVDNPLRDLDGLVLLAATLAVRGVQCYLVPMYEQGFDIMAIQPDLVVANYVRANNRDLLVAYKKHGVRVVVLDTEGAAGRVAEDFAVMVARMQPGEIVDAYCVWGDDRYAALKRKRVIADARVHLTGCPRFDYCAPQWRAALAPLEVEDGFLLVNTNFPLINPRFAANAEVERQTLVRVWNDTAYVDAVFRDARAALAGMLASVNATARAFPRARIVIRPHPFEAVEAYLERIEHSNITVRQEGTSLQWIARSCALIHQNCSTAIEAAMLGREPLSLDWLSSNALRVTGPGEVSRSLRSQQQLEALIGHLLEGRCLPGNAGLDCARSAMIAALFHANDGRSAERVASVILECLRRPPVACPRDSESPRGKAARLARGLLGHRASGGIRGWSSARAQRIRAKSFCAGQVSSLLERLIGCGQWSTTLRAERVPPEACAAPRMCSGSAVLVSGR
jgi:surface carbohydrate biosynthesis protein